VTFDDRQHAALRLVESSAERQSLITQYVELGFPLVFWSRESDPKNDWKGPREEGWQTKTYIPSDYQDGLQVGVKTGTEIQLGRFLLDVDFDWIPGIEFAHRFLPNTGFVVGRPSKKIGHAFYTTSTPVVALKYKDIDGTTLVERRGTKTDGTIGLQTVLPPSVYRATGEVLALTANGDIVHNDTVVDCVTSYATACLLGRHWPKNGPDTNQHDTAAYAAGLLCKCGVDPVVVVVIIEIAATLGGDDNVGDRVRYARDTVAKFQAGEKKLAGGSNLAKEIGKEVVARVHEWLGTTTQDAHGFITDHHGKILANSPKNIRHALSRLDAVLSFDSFANKPLVKYGDRCVFLGDAMRNRLWLDIDERFGFLPTQALFDVVLQDTAHRNPFHPVRGYLASLKWDGVPRVDKWLATYGKAADTDYVRAVSGLVLIAAVRRVMQPGCKFDEMLVLESSVQGLQKSTALRALCPKADWFSDDLPLHVDSKQIIERTCGKWIIEAADLSGKSKASVEQLKASLSRQVDGPVRLAYAHLPDEIPRQFIIIGTTNSLKYLKDSTGNRRFWPVRVEKFDVDGLTRDRDQLWAEVVQRERAGESIRLDESLYSKAQTQQDQRLLEDAWESPLSMLFEDNTKEYRITTDELWNTLDITIDRRNDTGSFTLNNLGP